MWFDSLPEQDKKFLSWAPGIRGGWGLLKLREFEEWKNIDLLTRYEDEKKKWLAANKVLNETLLYHGTPTPEPIKQNGFLLSKVGSSSGNCGLFGAGVYFANAPTGAIGYSTTEHQNDALSSYSVIVSKVLVGKKLELPWGGITTNKDRERAAGVPEHLLAFPFTGIGLIDGYDTHGCGGEVCVFNEAQILPIGMLHMDVIPYKT